MNPSILNFFFFFNDTATTEIYTLSLHDALPISLIPPPKGLFGRGVAVCGVFIPDRKSTRLNSSHVSISYAVFCLKKKKFNNCIVLLTVKLCTGLVIGKKWHL